MKSVKRAVMAVVWCGMNAGCIADQTQEVSMSNPESKKPLISIESAGGMVSPPSIKPEVSHFLFYDDGYTERRIGNKASTGNLEANELTKLKKEIYLIDFNEVKKTKFSGVCPTVYDGAETVFIFHLSTGDIRINSCEHELNDFSLFRVIDELSQKYHKGYKLLGN